jgi:hypothetical protein
MLIAEPGDRVRAAIPAWVKELSTVPVVGPVPVGPVVENVPGMVNDHIQHDEYAVLVGDLD